jgi:hypothetical protein
MAVANEMPQLVAVTELVLATAAKTVAETPTCTERLDGKTAAIIVCAKPEEGAKSKMLHVTMIARQRLITYLLRCIRVEHSAGRARVSLIALSMDMGQLQNLAKFL